MDMEVQRSHETSILWSNLDPGMLLLLRFRKFWSFYSLAMNLQLMARMRRHGRANVLLLFHNVQMHFRLAGSDVSMTAAWERAAGHCHAPSRAEQAQDDDMIISNTISNLIMFDRRDSLCCPQKW